MMVPDPKKCDICGRREKLSDVVVQGHTILHACELCAPTAALYADIVKPQNNRSPA